MPSPVGHILAGTAVYLAGTSKENRRRPILGIALLGSILPDFDFLPGILVAAPAAFHHGISHSLLFAILYGALVFLLFRSFHREIATQAAVLGMLAYVSHLLLDLVSVNEGGRGIPIIWPLSEHQFGFNLHVFGHFHHGGLNQGIRSVVRWDNVPAVGRELLVTGLPVLFFLWKDYWKPAQARCVPNEFDGAKG